MTSKISYHVQSKMTYGRDYSAAELDYLFQHLERLQPGALLFLDQTDWAKRAKQLLPNCAVVIRPWDINEGAQFEQYSARQYYDKFAGKADGGLILNILNEPSGYGDLKRIAHWGAEILDLFGKAGISVALPAFGEGHPDVNRLHDLDELWSAFDAWNHLHYWNSHEYGTWRGMIYNEPGKWDVYPWRVGRFETFIVPFLKENGHKIPRVILTEFGCDSAHDSTDKRGWKTIWNEREYFDQLKLAVEKVYNQPHYVGLCLFSYGNTGREFAEFDWVSFDVSGAKELHGLLEQYAAQDSPTTPPPPVIANPPLPVDLGEPMTIDVDGVWLMRSEPRASSAKIGTLRNRERILVYPKTQYPDGSNLWHVVKRLKPTEGEASEGWSAVSIIPPVVPLPPPAEPEPPPVPAIPDWRPEFIEMYRQQAAIALAQHSLYIMLANKLQEQLDAA